MGERVTDLERFALEQIWRPYWPNHPDGRPGEHYGQRLRHTLAETVEHLRRYPAWADRVLDRVYQAGPPTFPQYLRHDLVDLVREACAERRAEPQRPQAAAVRSLRPARDRVAAMMDDPHLTGNLLLIALAWAHLIQTPRRLNSAEVSTVTGLSAVMVRYELERDVPRYEAPPRPRMCPMVGPRGGACPRVVSTSASLLNPDDGTVTWAVACANRAHRAVARDAMEANAAQLADRQPPPAPYNTRSRVAHHFPEINFTTWWPKLGPVGWHRQPYTVELDPDRRADPTRGAGLLRLVDP